MNIWDSLFASLQRFYSTIQILILSINSLVPSAHENWEVFVIYVIVYIKFTLKFNPI